jgi:hypothetical protein
MSVCFVLERDLSAYVWCGAAWVCVIVGAWAVPMSVLCLSVTCVVWGRLGLCHCWCLGCVRMYLCVYLCFEHDWCL